MSKNIIIKKIIIKYKKIYIKYINIMYNILEKLKITDAFITIYTKVLLQILKTRLF